MGRQAGHAEAAPEEARRVVTDKCTYCGTPLSRAVNGKCSCCGAPADVDTQLKHQMYRDSKYGRLLRDWLELQQRDRGTVEALYDAQTRVIEHLERLRRVFHAQGHAEPYGDSYMHDVAQRAIRAALQRVDRDLQLDFLLRGLITLVKEERLDTDIARTRGAS